MRTALYLNAMIAIVACGGPDIGTPWVNVRDSAGVTIVENAGDSAAWTGRATWMVPREPVVDIGILEGEEPYQLFRVSDAARLPDGRIVVANGGTGELRFFDADGRYLMSVGRPGSGPGEFQALGPLAVLGDSIAAYDWSLRRVSLFATDGTFIRSYVMRFPSGASPLGAFGDGRWLCTTDVAFSLGDVSTVRRDTATLLVMGNDGTFEDSLFSYPGWEFYMAPEFLMQAGGTVVMTQAQSLPFGRGAQHAVFEAGFWFGVTDRYEIARYAPDGRLELLLRKDHTNRPVTQADVATYKAAALDETDDPNARRRTERLFADMPIPTSMPAFADLQVDAETNLWVAEYMPPSADSSMWTVYDHDGRMRAAVRLPPDLRVVEIGRDYLVALATDELDVPHVRLYRIVKEGGDW